MVKRQRFTAEFKREAVRLLDAGERPASEVAIDLGIRRNQLYKWKAEQVRSGELSFPGSGRKPANQDSCCGGGVRSCFATFRAVVCAYVPPSSHRICRSAVPRNGAGRRARLDLPG